MEGHVTQDQADAYALGALEPEVARAVVLHSDSCEACARLVMASERVTASLALGIPRQTSPARLKDRVLTSAGIRRPGPFVLALRLVTAGTGIAAVVVAVAALTGLFSLRGQVNELKVQNASLQTQVDEALSTRVELAAVTRRLDQEEQKSWELRWEAQNDRELLIALLSPESDVAEVYPVDEGERAIGRLVWDEEQKKVWFVASQLATLPSGQTYQLWGSSGGQYVSLGTFAPDATGYARYETVVPQGLKSYESAVVTIEPSPGSPAREGPSVFVTNLSRLRTDE